MNVIDLDRRTMVRTIGGTVALAASAVATTSIAASTPSAQRGAAKGGAGSVADKENGPSQGPSPMNQVWNHDQVALLLIDYQPEMFADVHSETPPALIELNVIFMIRIAKALNIPIVLSEVAVKLGVRKPIVPAIANELPGVTPIDRNTMNAWEDDNFRKAVEATGKKRLIFGALFTEICLAFPVIDAMKDGYQAMFVQDMCGGESPVAHNAAVSRVTQAGAIPNSAIGLSAELFRNWASAQGHVAKPIIAWYLEAVKKRGLHN